MSRTPERQNEVNLAQGNNDLELNQRVPQSLLANNAQNAEPVDSDLESPNARDNSGSPEAENENFRHTTSSEGLSQNGFH
jgi:hypothetical protein